MFTNIVAVLVYDFWPLWFVAVLVCGRLRSGRFGLRPFWTWPS